MNFEKFSTLFLLLMWIVVEQVLKLTNLTNRMNIQDHVRAMKIRPKIEKLNMASYDDIFIQDHEETCFIWFWDIFHLIREKISFFKSWWKVCLMEFDERKSFEVDGKNDLVEKTSEKFEFSFLEKFFSLNKLQWNGKSWKLELNGANESLKGWKWVVI